MGPFLLMDRQDPGRIFSPPAVAVSTETPDFVSFQEKLRPFAYSPEKWKKTRARMEQGLLPGETPFLDFGASVAASSAAHRPPPPEVELPAYGTSLSVTGRKVISFQLSERRYIHPQITTNRPQTTSLFDLNQQLQLRMQGKVGPKITVAVDYDDSKANKQDISVVYQGDPNEVVQNVSFGDIDLSLPASEFVSYNKQLFGIRADIKYKGLKASIIASRTKGQTKIRQFNGNTQFIQTDIQDTAYLRRQHYDITFGNPARLPIRSGTEKIYLAQQLPQAGNVNQATLMADDLAVAGSTVTANFIQLIPGQDYTVDYVNGILTFRQQLQSQFIVAVDFIDASGNNITVQSTTSFAGGTGRIKLIKTPADVPISTTSEVGYNRELKTIYSLGQNQIVGDNGRGNFILRVFDANRNEVGSTLDPPQVYPQNITVDFANGFFRLLKPFSVSNASPTVADPDLYAPTPIHKRLFHAEFFYRFKTFFLEPNLVSLSEVITVDSTRLNRNVDYFIDYEAGFVTFFNEDRLRPDSLINIAYEVAPFIGSTNESLLGTRVAYDFGKVFSMGSTLLYQAGTKSPTVPTITELARSLLTYEADFHIKGAKVLGMNFTMNAEAAQSRQNLNLNGFALIDNMEGVKQEDVAPTIATSWQIASNPDGTPSDPSKVHWVSEDVRVLAINPNAQAGQDETQKTLNFAYDFTNAASTEASIVYPFSIAGADFSQKNILHLVMLGDASLNELNFHLGGINEDADGSGQLKTEDLDNDKILAAAEDIGWCYAYGANPCAARFGGGNGQLDSDDLSRDGDLDPADFNGGDFGYKGNPATGANQLFDRTSNVNRTTIDFGTDRWRTFQIPLNISSANANLWTAVKHIRISVRRRPGGNATGVVKFAQIAVVGNTWLRGQPGDPSRGIDQIGSEKLIVTPINNNDNPSYVPIYNAGGQAKEVFQDLYGDFGNLQRQSGSRNISEQALELQFQNLVTTAAVSTKKIFTRAVDISQHRYFNFLVHGNADAANADVSGDKVFYLRAGNDSNFFEVQVPLTFTGWKKIQVEQVDTSGGTVPNTWRADTAGTVAVTSGAPTLQQIATIVAGVRSTGLSNNTRPNGSLYLNEIYLSKPVSRVGTAAKVDFAFDAPGWASFGGKHFQIDRNFQTPTSVLSNQNRWSDSAFLNFNRLPFLPLTFNLARTVTETPSTALTGDLSNVVNLLQQGKVVNWNGAAAGSLSLGRLPRTSVNYTRDRIEYDLLTRTDDRQGWTGTLSYAVPLKLFFIPRTVDANYSHARSLVKYQSLKILRVPGNANTDEITESYGLRMPFEQWPGSSLSTNYTLTRVREKRDDYSHGPALLHLAYPKSLNQNAAVTSGWKITRWLIPQINYSVTVIQNNILSSQSFVVNGASVSFDIAKLKTVNRNANGSINIPLAFSDIFPSARILRSANVAAGYSLQDGDVWNNIEEDMRTETKIWVRSPLRPRSVVAQRANLTLRDTYNSTQRWSPLEAFDLPGRWAAFRTLAVSNNYIKSIQRSEVTGTVTKTVNTTNPDAVANIRDLEKLWSAERWMASTQMNFKYSAHKTETVGESSSEDENFGTDLRTIIMRKFDTSVSYNNRKSQNKDLRLGQVTQRTSHEDGTAQVTFDYFKFRFTPKIDYNNDRTTLGSGVKTQDTTVITPNLLVRADLVLPRGLRLPGSTKTFLFTNRIIWTTTTSLVIRKSPVTIADNSKLFSLNTSADYEIAKNLRMNLNGAASRLWHNYLKEDAYLSYQIGSTMTFQF